jgi:hypothetical protein
VLGAHASEDGVPITVLPSSARGESVSRIVHRLSGSITTSRGDVGVVVTEHGAADLRGLSLRGRVRRMLELADPRHREALERRHMAWARSRRNTIRSPRAEVRTHANRRLLAAGSQWRECKFKFRSSPETPAAPPPVHASADRHRFWTAFSTCVPNAGRLCSPSRGGPVLCLTLVRRGCGSLLDPDVLTSRTASR